MRKIERSGEPKKVKAEKPKKEFKIKIVEIGKLEENTGTWPAPGNWGNHVYDRDANSRHSQNSTSSYF